MQNSKSFHKENPQKLINSRLNSRALGKSADISRWEEIGPFPGKVIWDHCSLPSANFSAGLTTWICSQMPLTQRVGSKNPRELSLCRALVGRHFFPSWFYLGPRRSRSLCSKEQKKHTLPGTQGHKNAEQTPFDRKTDAACDELWLWCYHPSTPHTPHYMPTGWY